VTEISDLLSQATVEDLLEALEKRTGSAVQTTFSNKSKARRLALQVRPRVMQFMPQLSGGEPAERGENLLIEGDNLQALVTLYKERGNIDLIVTDPPYNTGNDFRYNDKWETDPNDQGIGDFVSVDDGAKHTKWMRFMYPRLRVMHEMLKDSGVLAICIDYRELFHLGTMLDEIFGEANRLAIINWQKSTALKNDNNHVSSSTEYVLVYGKSTVKAKTQALARTDSQTSRYSSPDGDPRGLWREGQLHVRTWVEKDDYGIQSPFTGEIHYPTGKSAWRHPKRDIKKWLEQWGVQYEERKLDDDRVPALVISKSISLQEAEVSARKVLDRGVWPFIWFGRKGLGLPRKKIFLEEVRAGKIPETYWSADDFSDESLDSPLALDSTSWSYSQSGRSSDGAGELAALVGKTHGFSTVKPLKLIQKIIQIWCPLDGVVLDPFAGSGTTGHAVLALNRDESCDRRFILIEQGRPEKGDSYAQTLTVSRLTAAITGEWANGKGIAAGGGYSFLKMSKKVDGPALLQMERQEMTDVVVFSHTGDGRQRGSNLTRAEGATYLVATNSANEGFYLIWDGADEPNDFTEDVYEACVEEAVAAGLTPIFHVYARRELFQRAGVRYYQIPDRILADFGLDVRSEPFTEGAVDV
jgi:adenine-specific DNA-methyltransferase